MKRLFGKKNFMSAGKNMTIQEAGSAGGEVDELLIVLKLIC